MDDSQMSGCEGSEEVLCVSQMIKVCHCSKKCLGQAESGSNSGWTSSQS